MVADEAATRENHFTAEGPTPPHPFLCQTPRLWPAAAPAGRPQPTARGIARNVMSYAVSLSLFFFPLPFF